LVVEDKLKQQAIFVTQSFHITNRTYGSLIDAVTVLKIALAADNEVI
jgi:hypothetical protein